MEKWSGEGTVTKQEPEGTSKRDERQEFKQERKRVAREVRVCGKNGRTSRRDERASEEGSIEGRIDCQCQA